ncbi:MAG: nucleotidyltransferase domain-containing protein [Candidatus Methylomirabilia bacterium]
MVSESIRSRIRAALTDRFGARLHGTVLYGSEARGEAGPDSDIDVLVLLDGPVQWTRDVRAIIEVLYPLVLELERPIHAVPVDIRKYEAQEFGLYRNARREGVPV